MAKKRSQVSMEYMIVIGFVTLITIPLVIIYMKFSEESNEEIAAAKVNAMAKKIVDAAESMYYLGEPSQTTLTLSVPINIVSANASQGELVYRFRSVKGVSDIVVNSAVEINGTLPIEVGTYRITIVARSGYVEVSYT